MYMQGLRLLPPVCNMLTTKSIVALNIRCCPNGGANRRRLFQVSRSKLSCPYPTSRLNKQKCQFLGREILPIFSSAPELFYATISKIEKVVQSGVNPVPAPPNGGSHGSWKLWIVGMLLSVVLPSFRNKWSPLQQLKNKVESIVQTADEVVEIVEKVADEVEKLAEGAAEFLPDGSKLKQAALLIERIAEEAESEAHLAGDLIDKVEEVEKLVESIIESAIDQTTLIDEEAATSEPDAEAIVNGPQLQANDQPTSG